MAEQVKYGDNSAYLTRLSLKEMKRLSAQQLTLTLQKVLSTQTSIHYSGTLPSTDVSDVVGKYFAADKVINESVNPTFRDGLTYSNAKVFFFNDPKATQSIVQAYMHGPKQSEVEAKFLSQLFNTYFGAGMSSLMFQEIREFRSLAYRASSTIENPPVKLSDKSMLFNMHLSTQADKTTDALQALQSLLVDMPLSEKRLDAAKENLINQAQSAYPNFRDKSQRIAQYKQLGYTEDPNKQLVDEVSGMTLSDLERFYKQHIQGQTVVYVVIGNKKNIDMTQLQQMGEFEEMKLKQFLK